MPQKCAQLYCRKNVSRKYVGCLLNYGKSARCAPPLRLLHRWLAVVKPLAQPKISRRHEANRAASLHRERILVTMRSPRTHAKQARMHATA